MGKTRNGARSFLDVMLAACRFSRMPGFRTGLNLILGEANATTVMALWEPLCVVIDGFNSIDNFFNQKDTANDDGAGEDATPGI